MSRMSVASLGNCSNATRTSSEVFCTGMYTHAIAHFFLLTCVRLPPSLPPTHMILVVVLFLLVLVSYSPPPPPPTISTTLPELRRNLNPLPQAIKHRAAATQITNISDSETLHIQVDENCVAALCPLSFSCFSHPPSFLGYPGKKKGKKEEEER